MDFDDWYMELQGIASSYGYSVSDRQAWKDCYDFGWTPSEAFYDEYPELLEDDK